LDVSVDRLAPGVGATPPRRSTAFPVSTPRRSPASEDSPVSLPARGGASFTAPTQTLLFCGLARLFMLTSSPLSITQLVIIALGDCLVRLSLLGESARALPVLIGCVSFCLGALPTRIIKSSRAHRRSPGPDRLPTRHPESSFKGDLVTYWGGFNAAALQLESLHFEGGG